MRGERERERERERGRETNDCVKIETVRKREKLWVKRKTMRKREKWLWVRKRESELNE